MIISRISIQGENIIEHPNVMCHVCYNLVYKRKIFLSILMPSVHLCTL